MPAIITIGNALIDSFLLLQDDTTHAHVNHEKKLLSVDYGQKIMLNACEFHLGGNAANVAVGLSRLGHTASIMAEIGNDEFSDKIMHILHGEKVNTKYLLHDTAPTSFSVNLQFQGERTIFVQHQNRSHAFDLTHLKTDWVYLTSLGESWKHVYKGMITHAKKYPDVLLSCNPGTKQFEQGKELILELLPHLAVFIANKEEYASLLSDTGKKPTDTPAAALLTQLHTKSTGVFVLTDGENGSYVMDNEGQLYHMNTIATKVAGKTGAGDAFSTGFMSAFMQHSTIEAAMRLGTVNAASVVGKIGAQTGLLHKSDVVSWRERMNKLTFTTIRL